jgi:hypothetical protein
MGQLPEGRKALSDEWFVDRANKEVNGMNRDESDAIALVSEMQRQNLTLAQALEAMKTYADDVQFQKDLDTVYGNEVFEDWDYWHEGDID